MNYKAKPIYTKDKDDIIATKVDKDRLQEDFDGYYERMKTLLGANKLKIEDYDNNKVLIYDKDKWSGDKIG